MPLDGTPVWPPVGVVILVTMAAADEAGETRIPGCGARGGTEVGAVRGRKESRDCTP